MTPRMIRKFHPVIEFFLLFLYTVIIIISLIDAVFRRIGNEEPHETKKNFPEQPL